MSLCDLFEKEEKSLRSVHFPFYFDALTQQFYDMSVHATHITHMRYCCERLKQRRNIISNILKYEINTVSVYCDDFYKYGFISFHISLGFQCINDIDDKLSRQFILTVSNNKTKLIIKKKTENQ